MTKCYDCNQRQELTDKIEALLTDEEKNEYQKIRTQLLTPSFLYNASTLVDSFAYLSQNRDKRSRENNLLTRTCISIIESSFRRFDEVGLDSFISRVGHKFLELDLDKLNAALYEESRLAHNASIFPNEMEEYLTYVERQKDIIRKKLKDGNFHFSDYQLSSVMGYIGPGASWLDGFKVVLGGVLVITNVVASVPTAGLAGASIVVGIAGVASGCSD
jgi:hypothetical protein